MSELGIERGPMGGKKVSAAVKDLTEREQEVFDLIVRQGLNNTEIAEHLGITERSAKFHTSNVLRKMGTSDRLKLAVRFWQGGGSIKAAKAASPAPKAAGRKAGKKKGRKGR
jgi:DNA-binding NarL/FixJ family response regulator